MSEKEPRLRVEGLKKVFRKKTAVRDVSFSMGEGEVVGLLGPNGAGKTTSFYMVVGFIKPTQGKIYLNDEDITSLPMYRRARLGISYLPQEPSVFSKLTVEKNIWAALEARGDISMEEKKERLEVLIDDLGVQKVRHQKA
ncbi:MAG: ATP-binding cassette domain-containing protein, partial [Spirochaetales bacterium]|nr:ATP-binding cassette domain-containing protein [Spirochaetales bacterium]